MIVTVVESLMIGILCAVFILATRNYFAIIFTDSVRMQKAVAKLAYLLGITMILNSVQPVISGKLTHRGSIFHAVIWIFKRNSTFFAGVAVGGGWQALVAYINLFSYYVIGLPLGFVLGYKTSLKVQVCIYI